MKEQIILTEQEAELIECIRNIKNTRHNYSFYYEKYVRELFEQLIEI